MSTANQGTPGFNEGWYNGNPHKWIEAGTYAKYRDRLPGLKYSDQDIADLDAANEAAEKIRSKNKPADGTEAAANAKLAEHQKDVDADIAAGAARDAAEVAPEKKAPKKKAAPKKAKAKKTTSDAK